ncbi:amino acid ABC transporter permease [Paenibacillus sp. alder61]|uniref:Amino acid ABC transporter permease n=1 Tax=Paenibacillus faecis TaxID=862114 RepID=A0A5D0CNI2_9BACL|nr:MULTISPECIES: amino acid ABC transporter permease [Paenibacillus]MCA1292107.1 amino acid ABC transporter permease [Paenibacillus sp. alder61]TYA11348.1 amino acid ABC transporter permease [Paenibacillus faecis]
MDFAGAYSGEFLVFLLDGLWMTLKIALISIVLSFTFGCLIGIVRYARVPVLSPVLAVLVELLRNLPLLLIILFSRFALPDLGLQLGPEGAAIAALTVFEMAMISEVVRGGLNSIPKGQIEAARSSGLSGVQTLRHIVLPQGLRRMVPPLVSQFISLLKDTSLATAIALAELMHNAQIIIGHSYNYAIPVLLLCAVIYFIVNYVLSLLSRRLENKMV